MDDYLLTDALLDTTAAHTPGNHDEHVFGSLDAARYLGLHRSTLHEAVAHGLIQPDSRTPGGHLRFRRETLDNFRRYLAVSSATGSPSGAPTRALGELLALLAERREPAAVGAAAVEGVCEALPGVTTCCVLRRAPQFGDIYAQTLLAQRGLPTAVMGLYQRLRRTFSFATVNALRTLEPEVNEDTANQRMHKGAEQLARAWQIGAYAVFPIVANGVGQGTLICICAQPRMFSKEDLLFLRGVAAALSVSFASASPLAKESAVETEDALAQEE